MFLRIVKLAVGVLAVISILATAWQYLYLSNFTVETVSLGTVSYQEAQPLLEQDELVCEWSQNEYFFFSENVFSQLIYYSHLIPIIGVLFVAIVVIGRVGLNFTTKPLLVLSLSFTLWCLLDLFTWSSDRPEQIMFAWSLLMPIEFIVYSSTFYLYYVLLKERPLSKKIFGTITSILLIPILIFLPTTLTLVGFNYSNCDREAIEGLMWTYLYVVEIIIILLIASLTLIHITSKASEPSSKRKDIVLTFGTCLFLIAFMLGNIVGTFSDDWSIAQYGLLGMPVFLAFIGYLIVRYRMFNISVLAVQALIVALWFLVGSLLFVARTTQTKVVAGFTLALVSVVGLVLVRSVMREIKQREQLQLLTNQLEKANERLKELDKAKSEFVSIASHQLRSPLTAIRGYASMLAEGSFGKMPEKAQESAKRIEESAKLMAMSIEDYLNVSRIESGNMKYNLSTK
jgi:signal transduction histidine kinase